MSKEQNNILIMVGYQAIEPAKKNFDQLTRLVKSKQTKSEGMILVEQDKDGKVSISETGDHLQQIRIDHVMYADHQSLF